MENFYEEMSLLGKNILNENLKQRVVIDEIMANFDMKAHPVEQLIKLINDDRNIKKTDNIYSLMGDFGKRKDEDLLADLIEEIQKQKPAYDKFIENITSKYSAEQLAGLKKILNKKPNVKVASNTDKQLKKGLMLK